MERRADPPGPPGGAGSRTHFSRTNRLHRTWQYQRAYREGRSRRGRAVIAYAHVAAGEPSRAGVVASRRVGPAVTRNRAKRRLRAVLAALWPRVLADGRQVVLIARPEAATVDFADLTNDVADLLQELGVLQP